MRTVIIKPSDSMGLSHTYMEFKTFSVFYSQVNFFYIKINHLAIKAHRKKKKSKKKPKPFDKEISKTRNKNQNNDQNVVLFKHACSFLTKFYRHNCTSNYVHSYLYLKCVPLFPMLLLI